MAPLGDPPDCLNAAEAMIWRQIVAQAAPGHLLEIHRIFVEVCCRLLAEQQEDPEAFPADRQAVLNDYLRDLDLERFRMH